MDLQEKALTQEEIAALSIEQVENLNVRVYDPRVLRKLMPVETSNPGVEKLLDIAAKTGALVIPLKEYAELLGEIEEEKKKTLQEKALEVIEELTCNDDFAVSNTRECKLLVRIYQFSHIARGRCECPHEDWVEELEKRWEHLLERKNEPSTS